MVCAQCYKADNSGALETKAKLSRTFLSGSGRSDWEARGLATFRENPQQPHSSTNLSPVNLPQLRASFSRLSTMAEQTVIGKRKPNEIQETSPHSNNSFLLSTGKFSDLIIEFQGIQFKVHRSVLCPQSAFFTAALEGGFVVNTTESGLICN